MQAFFDEHGFKLNDNGAYENSSKSVKIDYDEARQMYILSVADFDEDSKKFGEYSELSSWLFDDTQNAKDAVSVGIDFGVSLRKHLGIKHKRVASTADVELPTASKSGNMTVTGFAKKMLDVFPALKDEYKAHIATYGNFLYINFFGEHLVPCLNSLFSEGNKKQIKKLYDVFEDAYVKGDKDTVNILIALLCAASYKNESADTAIKTMLEEDKHFLSSYENFKAVFIKNKKLLSALVK
ncbi:MAG: hypothetical protein IKD04_04710 [Clostridia bacterium]|nr:hypothetical protein [Clostridia bacterium]